MMDSRIKDAVKLGDVKSVRKDIRTGVMGNIFFGFLLVSSNYLKTNSAVLLWSVIVVNISLIIYALIISVQIKREKTLFFKFNSIAFLILSNTCLGLSFSSYYAYLGFTSIVLSCILVLVNVTAAFLFYKFRGKKIIENHKMSTEKSLWAGIAVTIGTTGYLLGMSLSRQLEQFQIHILLIVLGFLLSCVFLIASSGSLLLYRLSLPLREKTSFKHKHKR